MNKSNQTLSHTELPFLMDIFRFTIHMHSSETDPISQALYHLVNAEDMVKLSKAKTLIAIFEYFKYEAETISFNDYYADMLNKENVKDHARWIRKLNSWDDTSIIDLAEELKLRHQLELNVSKLDSDALIHFVAEKLIEDRSKYLYYNAFKAKYKSHIEHHMKKFINKSDRDLYAWYNYQDGIDSHYECKSAARLEHITEGEYEEIIKIIDGKHSHISFKGKIADFSSGVQLYMKLR